MLPSEVVQVLGQDVVEGAWEPVFLLLTVGPAGYSQVCQLSRAEMKVSGDEIHCVVRARRTVANLRRDGRAVLVVVGDQAAYYLRLRAGTTLTEEDGSGLAVAFALEAAESDTLGIPLRPMMFQASSYVRDKERWSESRTLLERLAAGGQK